jgi:CubicO group peptidase (beta-lactamase class C family)
MKAEGILAATLAALLWSACAPAPPPTPVPPADETGVAPAAPAAAAERDTAGVGRVPPAAAVEEPVRLDPRFRVVDDAIQGAIGRQVTPGAVVAIGGREGVLYTRAYGAVDWADEAPRADGSTIYDLASLTKVVGTTMAVMVLVDRGRMALDDPLSRHLPAWPRGGWREDVTIRRLLTHTAGLAPFVRFWHPSAGGLRGRDAVVEAIVALPAAYPPGSRLTYSDLGFILLGAAVEEVAGESMDRFLAREVWTPLGMGDTGFRPLDRVPVERIAPTEVDMVYRGRHVHGEVHDENAHAMGGVAGHAGLFSTAADLAGFAQQLLRAVEDGLEADLPVAPATAARFATRQAGLTRALGWDAAPGSGGIARALSPRAFGHTGFTGTSLWLDPELDLFVVLLTNRVNPTREGTGIAELRRSVHELAAGARRGARTP